MRIKPGFHISIPGIVGFMTSAVAFLGDPRMLNYLPPKIAIAGTVLGIALQTFTKPPVNKQSS